MTSDFSSASQYDNRCWENAFKGLRTHDLNLEIYAQPNYKSRVRAKSGYLIVDKTLKC